MRHVPEQGRLKSVTADRMVLDQGALPARTDTLHVDGTAAGFAHTRPRPVFAPAAIHLQMLTSFQSTFSSAQRNRQALRPAAANLRTLLGRLAEAGRR
jgi:hypothetical protein